MECVCNFELFYSDVLTLSPAVLVLIFLVRPARVYGSRSSWCRRANFNLCVCLSFCLPGSLPKDNCGPISDEYVIEHTVQTRSFQLYQNEFICKVCCLFKVNPIAGHGFAGVDAIWCVHLIFSRCLCLRAGSLQYWECFICQNKV